MKNWKSLFLVLLFANFAISACGKGQKLPAPTGDTETPAQVTAVEEVEKSLVDGCDGGGSLSGAKNAFAADDFKDANRQARCVFNDSVKSDPNNSNTEAAFIAFLSSIALGVESPQFQFVFDVNVSANTVFGTGGDPDNLATQLAAKFTGNGMALIRNFFKFHEDKGHSIDDVVGKAMEFFTENFDDWHVLLKAMATDPKFVNAKIPAGFVDNSSDLPFTFTEASYFLVWADGLRLVGKIYPFYNLGITNSDSFADANTLVQDLNADPRFLSLRGDANGAGLIPYADLLLSSFARGAGNIRNRAPESWIVGGNFFGEILPKDSDGQAALGITVSQLKDSLAGRLVFLSVSKSQFGIDLKKMFSNLPNSATVGEVPFKVSGSDADFREEWLKEIVRPFTVLRE